MAASAASQNFTNLNNLVSTAGGTTLRVDATSTGKPAGASAATLLSLEHRAFDLINALRKERGMPALTWNEGVAKVARLHSQSMAEQKYFSHRGLDGSMVDDRADRAGLSDWREIGENIAFNRGVDEPADFAVEKWMESPAHRDNMLNRNWSDSAIGVAVAPDGSYYFTQVFLLRR
jgi:uncharacterized protein YkwD